MRSPVVSILGVFGSSFALTSFNKILFGRMQIPFPLLLTFFHFAVTSAVVRCRRPCAPDWRAVLPIALLTTLDVGLTNMAYSRVPLPVITVVKSVNLVTTYLLGVVFGLERFTFKLLSVCLLIVGAVAMSLPTGQGSDGLGLAFLLVAVVSMSFRWVLLQKLAERLDPLDVFQWTMPVSALGVLLMSICLEREDIVAWGSRVDLETGGLPLLLMLVSCLCAFSLIYFEIWTVKLTSSLTLLLSGACKEISILIMSALVFDEYLSTQQWVSILVSIYGIFLYWRIRNKKSQPSYRIQPQSHIVTGTVIFQDSPHSPSSSE